MPMARNIVKITYLSMLAIAATCAGCFKTVTIPIDEVRLSPVTIITRLKLGDDTRVAFDSVGGRYSVYSKMFTGLDENGANWTISLRNVDSVYYTFGYDSREFGQTAPTFKKLRERNTNGVSVEPIRGFCTDGERIKFDSHRGRFDSVNQLILGNGESGERLSVPLNEIDSVQVRRPDNVKTFLLISGIGVAAMATIIALTWEMNIELDLPPGFGE